MASSPDDPAAPLILTLRLDDRSFEVFEALRQRHFPTHRNFIPAHLTMFHHLPGDNLDTIMETLSSTADNQVSFEMTVTGLRFLGFGTAYEVVSPQLSLIRRELADKWRDDLTAQDARPFQPHITIQNKAPAGDAKALFNDLSKSFQQFEITATGLLLWRYLGGPWEPVRGFDFA